MLVLTRKRDESIVVGDDVIVTIVAIDGDRVRIGIEAPPEVAVHRLEVYEAIRRAEPDAGARDQKEPDENLA